MIRYLKNRATIRRERNAYRRMLITVLRKWGSAKGLTYQDCLDAWEVILKFKK